MRILFLYLTEANPIQPKQYVKSISTVYIILSPPISPYCIIPKVLKLSSLAIKLKMADAGKRRSKHPVLFKMAMKMAEESGRSSFRKYIFCLDKVAGPLISPIVHFGHRPLLTLKYPTTGNFPLKRYLGVGIWSYCQMFPKHCR